MAKAQRLRGQPLLRGDAQHRPRARDPKPDARGGFRHDLLRHRDAGARGAEGDREIAQYDHADPRQRARHQRPWHGGRVRASFSGSTPTRRTPGARIVEFLEQSHIPLATINLLQALPRTPLWDRLQREGRLRRDEPARESNVDFLMPYDDVLAMWRRLHGQGLCARALFARYEYQMRATRPNRLRAAVEPAAARAAQHPPWPSSCSRS